MRDLAAPPSFDINLMKIDEVPVSRATVEERVYVYCRYKFI